MKSKPKQHGVVELIGGPYDGAEILKVSKVKVVKIPSWIQTGPEYGDGFYGMAHYYVRSSSQLQYLKTTLK